MKFSDMFEWELEWPTEFKFWLGLHEAYASVDSKDTFILEYDLGEHTFRYIWDADSLEEALWEWMVACDRLSNKGYRRLPDWQDTPWG